jgi:hypothetical protein
MRFGRKVIGMERVTPGGRHRVLYVHRREEGAEGGDFEDEGPSLLSFFMIHSLYEHEFSRSQYKRSSATPWRSVLGCTSYRTCHSSPESKT